jgi:hypothetical protein
MVWRSCRIYRVEDDVMTRARQRKTIEIDRGLFLVRYAAAEDTTQPPSVTVTADTESDRSVNFLLHPDHRDAVLWQPGACLVVRATAPGRLWVEVTPSHSNGSAVATVRIEPITQGRATSLPSPQAKGQSGPFLDVSDFRVLGHVAGIGDVIVSANEWLAGPSAPSRIEGISIAWPGKPDDLEIRYSVKTAKPQTISDRMTTLGSFAGTRGKALALVGVALEISGPSASGLRLVAEASFLGSPALRMTGKRVVLSGPTGREPLVGLRLAPEQLGAAVSLQTPPIASKEKRPASGRVRVFRSRVKQDKSVAP